MINPNSAMQAGKQGLNFFSAIIQSGLVQTATGYLGKPVPGIGTNKESRSRESYKDPKAHSSWMFWLREKIPTFGNIGGVLAIFASVVLGRATQSDDPEKPGSRFGFLSTLLKWGGVLSVAGSIYSHFQGTFIADEEERSLYVLGGVLPEMLKDVDFNWAKDQGYLRDEDSTDHSPTSMSYNSDERVDILRPIEQLWSGESAVRAFYIGGPGTGKTHTMYHTLKQFEQYGKSKGKKVIIKELNGDVLAKGISKKSVLQQVADVAKDVAGEEGKALQQATDMLSTSTETKFQMAIGSLLDFANDCKDDEIRVISIDEIDKMWKLAEGDDGTPNLAKMAFIAKRFQDLLNSNKVHILMTGNGTVNKMCGIENLMAKGIIKREEDIPPELAGLRSRLLKVKVSMTAATLPTVCEMIGKELGRYSDIQIDGVLQTRLSCGYNGNKHDTLGLVSDDDGIPGFDKFIIRDEQEHVTKIDKRIFDLDVDSNKLLTALAYTRIQGRIVNDAIKKYVTDIRTGKVPSDRVLEEGGVKKITIAGLRKYIEEHAEFVEHKKALETEYAAEITTLNTTNERKRISEEQIQERLNHPHIKALIKKVIPLLQVSVDGNEPTTAASLKKSLSEINCSGTLTSVDLKKLLLALKFNGEEHDGLKGVYGQLTAFFTRDKLLTHDVDEIPQLVFGLNAELTRQVKMSQFKLTTHETEIETKIAGCTNLLELRKLLAPGSAERFKLEKYLGDAGVSKWRKLLEGSSLYAMKDKELPKLELEAETVLHNFAAHKGAEKERELELAASDPVKELNLWLQGVPATVLKQLAAANDIVKDSLDCLRRGENPETNSIIVLGALKEHYKGVMPKTAVAA